PAPGIWTVRLLGSGTYSVVVQAKTPMSLHDVRFEPTGGVALYATAPSPAVAFRVIDEAGENLGSLALEQSSAGSGRYSGAITRPSQRFRVLVEAADEQGNVFFQRVDPRLFEP